MSRSGTSDNGDNGDNEDDNEDDNVEDEERRLQTRRSLQVVAGRKKRKPRNDSEKQIYTLLKKREVGAKSHLKTTPNTSRRVVYVWNIFGFVLKRSGACHCQRPILDCLGEFRVMEANTVVAIACWSSLRR